MAGEPATLAPLPSVSTPDTAVDQAAPGPQAVPRVSLADAVGRLADFARRAYGRDRHLRLRTLLLPSDPTLQELLIETYQTAGVVGLLPRQRRAREPVNAYLIEVAWPRWLRVREAYLADLAQLTRLVEQQAFFEAIRRLNGNEVLLLTLEAQMLDPRALRELHEAARLYLLKRKRALHGLTRETAGITNQEFVAIDTAVREAIDNEHLKMLALHPDGERLLYRLGISLDQAEIAVREVFAQARQAIFEFGDELEAQPEHAWRYPPIVMGAAGAVLTQAGVAAQVPPFAAFLGNLADEKSFDPLSALFFVAGVVVMAVGLVVLPAGGVIVASIGSIDAGLTVYGAVRSYRKERELELANLAVVLAQGHALAPRPADYGLVAIEGWAALLTAAGFLGVLGRTVASARAASGAKAAAAGEQTLAADARSARAGAEEAAQASHARQAQSAQRRADTLAADRQARREARPRREPVRATRRSVRRRQAVGAPDERGVANPLGDEQTEFELIDSLDGQPGTRADDPLSTRARVQQMAPRDPAEVAKVAHKILKEAGGESRRALAIVRARHGDTELADQLARHIMTREPSFRGFGPALGGRESADFQRLVTGSDTEFVFDLPEPVGITAGGRPRTETRIDGLTASDLIDAKYTQGDIAQSQHLTRRRQIPAAAREELAVDRRIIEEARARARAAADAQREADTLDQMRRQLTLAETHGFLGVRWVCSTPDLAGYFQALYAASDLPAVFHVTFQAVPF